MHQTAISTADRANGADLGIRENWLPLFDRYGVDLVVSKTSIEHEGLSFGIDAWTVAPTQMSSTVRSPASGGSLSVDTHALAGDAGTMPDLAHVSAHVGADHEESVAEVVG